MIEQSRQELNQKMMAVAPSYAGVREVSLAFILGPDADKAAALESFINRGEAEPFQKVLDLVSLHVADGYHRSAYQILEVLAKSGYQPTRYGHEAALTFLVDKMLEGTFKIGAMTINQYIRNLVEACWPKLAGQVPTTEEAVVSRYSPVFNMGQGVIVNQLRAADAPNLLEIIESARNNAAQITEDLFTNGVYGWIVSFLEQSNQYQILSEGLYHNVLERLDAALKDSNSSVCRWHREVAL